MRRDVDLFAEQLPSLVARQRADLDAGQLRRTVRSLEGGREPFGHRTGTVRHCDEHRCGRWPAQQCAEQLDRCSIGPVEVVQDEDKGFRRREQLEQLSNGTVAAVALVLKRDLAPASEGRQRREDVRELCSDVVVQGFEKSRLESVDVLV